MSVVVVVACRVLRSTADSIVTARLRRALRRQFIGVHRRAIGRAIAVVARRFIDAIVRIVLVVSVRGHVIFAELVVFVRVILHSATLSRPHVV